MSTHYNFILNELTRVFKPKELLDKPYTFRKYGIVLLLGLTFISNTVQAQINRALHLSENSDYVEIPHNDKFNFTQNFTVSFWVKGELPQQSVSTPYNTVLMKSSGGTSGIPFGFQLINSGTDIGKVRVVRKNNSGNSVTYVSTARIDDGRFHYLSLVRDSIGNVLRLYVDASLQGAPVSDITGTINNNSGIYLGRKGDGTENFQGSIDEIRIWRTARTQSNIQSDRSSSVVNIAGLVAYYNMETGLKNISTTTVAAQSVSGYAGGNVTYYPTQKHYGNALHFDGNNDLVSLAANPGVLTNQLALELWVRPDRLTGTQTLAGQAGKWALKLKDGKVNFTVYTTTSATLNVSSNLQLLSTGKWYHLAAVFNGNGVDNRMELFINGEADNKITLPSAYSVSTSGTGMLIGGNGSVSASNEHFQGMLDEINLWKITRVADSVVLDMNRGVTYSSSNHLLYYQCDQGTPNGSNGSVSAMTNYVVGNTATLNNFTLSGNASNWVARAPYPVSPGANLLSGTTYNFEGSLSGQATGKILGQGFLTNSVTFPATYPDYTNNSITVIPAQGNNGSFEEDYTLPGGSFYYRSYVFGTEGTVLSDQSSGPCVTGFPIGNIVFTGGSVSLTASWTSVVNATGYDWVLTPSTGDFSTPEQSGTSQSPNVSLTKLDPGSRYYFYVRAKCGGGQGEWVGPAYFATLSSPSLTASDLLNDAYVDAEWALPTAYFAQNAPLGVHLQLKSGSTLLYEQSITDYSNYEGEPQPVFSYTGGGNTQQYYKVDNTASWPELNTWTMEAWLQTAAANTTSGILLRTVNGTDNFTIKLDSIRRVQLIVDAANVTQVYTFDYTQIPVEQWFHLALGYGNGGATLYINGESVATLVVPALSITGAEFQALYGANQTSMAELRFWNRVRSAEEIKYSRLTTAFTGVNQNSLLLHWKWIISNANPSDMATGYDGLNNFGELYQIGGGIVSGISNPGYIATPFYTAIRGSFRHVLGPSLSKPYRLSGYANGSGTIINAVYFPPLDSGKTLPYQAVQEVRADSTPFNVRISWKNKSKLSEYFRIRRTDNSGQNSVVLATISGTDRIDSVLTYVDEYQLADSNSLKNGVIYRYYVDTYSGTFNKYFDTLKYNTVNLPPVTVSASDNTYSDKIILSWNNLSAFGYDIRIKRDEETLTTLNSAETTYTDNFPVYGKRHRYSVLLIDPVTNQPVAAGFDRGSIPSNGMISGKVLTLDGNYSVKNVRIRLTNLTDNTQDSTLTDNSGSFNFNGLYYGKTGQFVLSSYYPLDPSHVFINTPRTLTLTEAAPQLSEVIILDSTGFSTDTTSTGFSLTGFTATPVSNADKVVLSCNYTLTPGDTLRLNVMRDNELIFIQTLVSGSSFTYDDLSGNPGFVYDYSISLYKLQGNIIKVLKREQSDITYPVVKSPSGFTATVSSALGVVNLVWSHTSLNYSGFRIYRASGPLPSDTVLIAELAPAVFAFVDKQTLPGTSGYNYVIRSKRTIENLTFESQNVLSGSINYPALPSLSNLTATASTSRNSVLLSWNLPGASPLNDTSFNFDGYLIYRTRTSNNVTSLVGKTYKHFARTFEDKSGVPGVAYTYSVKAFVRLKSPYTLADTNIVSAQVNKSVTYPLLKAPSNFTRTNNINNVTLNWTPSVNLSGSARNFDGQTVYFRIGSGPTDSVDIPLSVNSYIYYTNVTSATPINFAVRSYKIINGVKYVSNSVGGLGFATGINSSTLPIPPQFRASQDLPEHIRLTWNYPVYIYASFKIYRDGALLAVLPGGSREYYDYSAENFLTYIYEIEAVYEENTTLKASATGKRNALSSLQGRVYAEGSGYGLPFIEVTASATGYFARTFTDTSGHYVIENLPVQSSLPVTVTVDGGNTVFTGTSGAFPSTKSFSIEGERYKMYELDFISNHSPLSKDTSMLSVPEYVYAKADPERKRVIISWTPGNQLHDGFLVYRANTLIASVTKNETLVAYDTEGSQGVNYLYQVFAYKESSSGKVTGNPGIAYGTFPKVEPAIYLSAFPDIQNNSVNISWSHSYANHSRYEVRRNGDLVSSVSTISPMTYIDTLGVPGALYNYSVTAVEETTNSFVESQTVTTQANFPLMAEVTDLSISIPDTTLSCSTVISRNHVLLQWDYDSRCTGFLVYRNNQLIKILSAKEFMYRDTAGIPGLNTDYVVKAYLNINNTNYSSDGQTVNIQYPVVTAPFGLSYGTDNGFVNLEWSYSEKIAHSFEIWRYSTTPPTSQQIFTLKTDSLGNTTGNFSFVDETGFMGRNYTYKVKTVVLRNGIFYYSDFSPCTPSAITYPNIPAPIVPTGLTATDVASDGTFANYVFLQWDYEGNNIDGFFLYRNATQIASVGKGMRNYKHIANQTGGLNYEVRAWKLADDNGTPDTVISPPLADMGNIGQAALGTLSPLIATQGALSGQVQLNWTTGGSYTIYRDDIQIGTVTGTTYTDNNAVPGKHYIYEVSPNNPANRTPVEGWAKYDGYISGFAYQLGTSVGLGGVLVEASATFEGNTWYFSDTTDNSGGYAIEDIYYGAEARTFEVNAKLVQCGIKHEFLINPQSCLLSEFVPEVIQNNFYDKTSYKIKGNIRRQYTTCGLDSIRVWAEYEFANGSTLTTVNDAYTNQSGEYSLDINLAQIGLTRIRLMVDSVRNLSNGDSLVYRFVALGTNEWSGNALTCMDLVTYVDYEEILTFPVKISLVNG